MIVVITGSRDFNNYEYIKEKLKMYNISKIISGGARGADKLAEVYSYENNIPIEIYKAQWNKFGKKAGMIRNVEMLKKCQFAIFFWDGKSSGTKQGIEYCKKNDVNYIVFNYLKDLKNQKI